MILMMMNIMQTTMIIRLRSNEKKLHGPSCDTLEAAQKGEPKNCSSIKNFFSAISSWSICTRWSRMYDCRILLVFWISSGVIRCVSSVSEAQEEHRAHWGDPLHDPLDDDNPRARDTKPGIRITSSQITQISHQTEEPGSLSGLVPNDLVTQASSFHPCFTPSQELNVYKSHSILIPALSGSGAGMLAVVTTRRYDTELWPWTTLATRWTPPPSSRRSQMLFGCSASKLIDNNCCNPCNNSEYDEIKRNHLLTVLWLQRIGE